MLYNIISVLNITFITAQLLIDSNESDTLIQKDLLYTFLSSHIHFDHFGKHQTVYFTNNRHLRLIYTNPYLNVNTAKSDTLIQIKDIFLVKSV